MWARKSVKLLWFVICPIWIASLIFQSSSWISFKKSNEKSKNDLKTSMLFLVEFVHITRYTTREHEVETRWWWSHDWWRSCLAFFCDLGYLLNIQHVRLVSQTAKLSQKQFIMKFAAVLKFTIASHQPTQLAVASCGVAGLKMLIFYYVNL